MMYFVNLQLLVGGVEFLCFHTLGIIMPTETTFFSEGRVQPPTRFEFDTSNLLLHEQFHGQAMRNRSIEFFPSPEALERPKGPCEAFSVVVSFMAQAPDFFSWKKHDVDLQVFHFFRRKASRFSGVEIFGC